MVTLKLLLFLLILIAAKTDGARILGIFHFPSKSHHILGSSLLKALAAKGHKVTMISPFPLEKPLKNYEDIDMSNMLDFKEKGNLVEQVLKSKNSTFIGQMLLMKQQLTEANNLFFEHEAIKGLIESRRKFDLIIMCYAWNEAYLGLSHYFGASTIIFSTVGGSAMTNGLTQNPAPYSYVPNVFLSFPSKMTFIQRVGNALSYMFYELIYMIFIQPAQEQLRNLYLPEASPVKQLIANVSLVLLNSDISIESTRPYVPNMIQIGGFHLQQPKKLTKELQDFMDSSTEGVIFFSLGSNVKSSDLSDDKIEAILHCFKKLPLKVLWKFEKDNVINLPPNVKIGKWLPQNDILAHPNTRLFITHGGLLSTTEAVCHGVPMVSIPIFGDQEANVADAVANGYAVKVPFFEFTEEILTEAINEVLNNLMYRENIKMRSTILKDQPMKPLDKAIFWVEYVLRHKGAHHLKTGAMKLEWYQYYLLDVIGFLSAIVLLVFIGCYLTIKKLMSVVKTKILKRKQKKNKLE